MKQVIELPIIICGEIKKPADNYIEINYSGDITVRIARPTKSDMRKIYDYNQDLSKLKIYETASYIAQFAHNFLKKGSKTKLEAIELASLISGYSKEMHARDFELICKHLCLKSTTYDLVETELGNDQIMDEWMRSDAFTAMRQAVPASPFTEDTIGLMTMRGNMMDFTYWIGLLYPAGTEVPEGYRSLDLPESDIGVAWVCGKQENGEIFGDAHNVVCEELERNGLGKFRDDIAGAGNDTYCFFERYNCPRFTEKDADGNVTLDYGNYIV